MSVRFPALLPPPLLPRSLPVPLSPFIIYIIYLVVSPVFSVILFISNVLYLSALLFVLSLLFLSFIAHHDKPESGTCSSASLVCMLMFPFSVLSPDTPLIPPPSAVVVKVIVMVSESCEHRHPTLTLLGTHAYTAARPPLPPHLPCVPWFSVPPLPSPSPP